MFKTMKLKQVSIIAGLLLMIGMTACSPEQIAAYNSLSPEGKAAVNAHFRSLSDYGNHPFLVCVRAHESDTSGGYRAQNPRSSASGAYQFLDRTWRNVAPAAGYGGYARAIHAPPHVQDAVAYNLAITRGQRFHWNGTGC